MNNHFQARLPNKIGFERANALYRDQAKKQVFYGADARILADGVHYSKPEGDFRVTVNHDSVSIQANIKEQFIAKKDELISRVLQPGEGIVTTAFCKMPYKIFGTGLSRTGTTSLHEALKKLGVFSTHHAPFLFPAIKDNIRALDAIPEYDAYIDTPFSYLYKELDKAYPGSKFIHTERDVTSWADSFKWLLGNSSTPMSRWFYEAEKWDADQYMSKYLAHRADLDTFFKNRPNDFLVLDFSQGDGWQKLCRFLDKSIPGESFPSKNAKKGDSSGLAKSNRQIKT